ncbi:hypothetical protein KGP24_08440 [Enterobacter sp. JBIWA008]|nr:hypothetical protein KGP24_08440 [Enterobacter sp. JBIWA008]
MITQWQEADLQFIQRILSEVGIYWRTEMDDVRDLDTYIYADSQLHYRFEGRADLAQHRHRDRHHTGLQLPDLHHERELNRSARIHLFSNASHLTPGQVLEPQGDVITALKEGVVLTLVTYRGARDSRLHVSVWGLPYTERYCFRPADIPCQEIHGTLRGACRKPGYGYLWLRTAKSYAGQWAAIVNGST